MTVEREAAFLQKMRESNCDIILAVLLDGEIVGLAGIPGAFARGSAAGRSRCSCVWCCSERQG